VSLNCEGLTLGSSPRLKPMDDPSGLLDAVEVWLGSDLAKPGVNVNDASAAAMLAVRMNERMFRASSVEMTGMVPSLDRTVRSRRVAMGDSPPAVPDPCDKATPRQNVAAS